MNDSVSVANRARKGPQGLQQLTLCFDGLFDDLPFHYWALRHLLNFCEGVNLEPHKQRQRNDPEYMRITHELMHEYLDELGGMAGQW